MKTAYRRQYLVNTNPIKLHNYSIDFLIFILQINQPRTLNLFTNHSRQSVFFQLKYQLRQKSIGGLVYEL